MGKRTRNILPTAANRACTTSPSASVALPPRHMADALSPTRHGVLGCTTAATPVTSRLAESPMLSRELLTHTAPDSGLTVPLPDRCRAQARGRIHVHVQSANLP